MKNNNQVIIERDMHCPYCNENSAVLISETTKSKQVVGCAPVGVKNGCLLYVTGGCWAIISGFPIYDVKAEYTTNLYGFCPCCGNTYVVTKPEIQESTVIDRLQDTRQGISHLADQTRNLFNNNDR